MADQYGFHGELGRRLWVAAAWKHIGRPSSPHVGVVAVFPHHVVKIVGGQDSRGRFLVQDNHGRGGGHEYYRSVHGAVFREV